jgi:uncharacterized membrane protein
VKPEDSRRSTVEIGTAATAIGAIGGLVALTVTGILGSLPGWAAVLIVVAELLTPFLVYIVLQRAEKKR